MKLALVFPGQGSQYVGMAKDIYERNDNIKKFIDDSCNYLNFDIKKIMFEGPDSELSLTENTQPAILIHSMAILKVIKNEMNFKYDVCLGLSLGEYSALVAAGIMSYEDALILVKKRGRYMQEAVPAGKGTMAAILGMDRQKVIDIIKGVRGGIVEIANYNSPGQIVISGEVLKVKEVMEMCKEQGAKRTVMLNVSGPFHSSMLKSAGEKIKADLKDIKINKSNIRVVSNVTADYYGNDFIDLLERQVSSSVRWEDSIEKLLNEGYNTFVEIGPGKTLKSFIKKISSKVGKNIDLYNVDGIKSLNEFINNFRMEK